MHLGPAGAVTETLMRAPMATRLDFAPSNLSLIQWFLFLNPGNKNHWIKLKLEGAKSNRVAIGARIKVSVTAPAGPRCIYKTVNSGGSFGSSPLRQEIGLGDATAIDSVEIFWAASGIHQKLTGFVLDHAYRIREDSSRPVALELKHIDFGSAIAHTHGH